MVVLKCSYFTQVDKGDLGHELMKRPRVFIALVEFLSSRGTKTWGYLLGFRPKVNGGTNVA